MQTELETWETQTDCQLTASLWKTDFAFAKVKQQDKNFLKSKILLRCAKRSRANAKAKADRAECKTEISEKVTSDMFDENKEVKQHFEEATSKAESLQPELREINKTSSFLQVNLVDYEVANTSFQEPLTKKTNQRPTRRQKTCEETPSDKSWNWLSTCRSYPIDSSCRWETIWKAWKLPACPLNPCQPLALEKLRKLQFFQCQIWYQQFFFSLSSFTLS